MTESFQDLVKQGDQALLEDNTLVALVKYETASKIEPHPRILAKLGYCLARERQQLQKGFTLCREALQADPTNADHFYQLGRIYLLAHQKNKAIEIFRKGLKRQRHQQIIDELSKLGVRKPPVFPSLPREHPINKSLGRLMNWLGAR